MGGEQLGGGVLDLLHATLGGYACVDWRPLAEAVVTAGGDRVEACVEGLGVLLGACGADDYRQ